MTRCSSFLFFAVFGGEYSSSAFTRTSQKHMESGDFTGQTCGPKKKNGNEGILILVGRHELKHSLDGITLLTLSAEECVVVKVAERFEIN